MESIKVLVHSGEPDAYCYPSVYSFLSHLKLSKCYCDLSIVSYLPENWILKDKFCCSQISASAYMWKLSVESAWNMNTTQQKPSIYWGISDYSTMQQITPYNVLCMHHRPNGVCTLLACTGQNGMYTHWNSLCTGNDAWFVHIITLYIVDARDSVHGQNYLCIYT